ncbi:SIR2 family NAD-dependent protein deacylase [Cochlodiniinecator piscidefendens]|uniref:SIR2 family NAD-dependent protein deacylase n=1 Tax=Cochlodiniinecator piscidefendens TaxID=2715756 RepID=UPI001409EFD9|nr:SIR2 family protein [Cochlodiniinecator piscidefendens]
MTSFHDPYRHLKYLRQSLSQDGEAIGFFVSAGCPLAVDMPDGQWPLIPDVAALTKKITDKLGGTEKYDLLLSELGKAEKNVENVEDILSFLRGLRSVAKGGDVRGFSETDLMALEQSICDEIVSVLDVPLPSNETPYHQMCSWIRSIDRKVAIEIFTTNYDLLMEQALEDYEVPYFDGFVGAKKSFFDLRAVEDDMIPNHWTRLWKIHGSINWHQETVEESKRVFRSSSVHESNSHLIYPSHLKYEESRKMPYLALIDQLNKFIRRKSSFLILSGYSFNDGHLNDAILNALKANPTGMVLALQFGTYDFSEDDVGVGERYPNAYSLAKRQHNLNVWTYDKAIIGTNLCDWKVLQNPDDVDRDLREFVHNITLEDEAGATRQEVQLGNFSELTRFLKNLIGSDLGEINAN